MLVLARKTGERVCIGDNIVVAISSVHGDTVRLAIEAPRDVPVHRQEVKDRIDGEAGK